MLDKIIVGKRIKEYRRSKDVSQEKLGEVLGKSHAAISDIERGKTEISVQDLLKISSFLDIPMQSFLEGAVVNNDQMRNVFAHNRETASNSDKPILTPKDIETIRNLVIEELKKSDINNNDQRK